MAKSKYYYEVSPGCVLCLMCVYECPAGAISVKEDVSTRIDANKCIGCGRCADNCQSEAIHRLERENNV